MENTDKGRAVVVTGAVRVVEGVCGGRVVEGAGGCRIVKGIIMAR